MRFNFRLESILRLRERAEENARLDLVKVRNKLAILESELEVLEEKIKITSDKLLKRLEEGSSGAEIHEWKVYMEKLEEEKYNLREEISAKKAEEQEKLKIYLEKRKERMALEKLKERRYKEYLRELDYREKKFLDEVAEKNHWRSKLK